MRFGVTVAGTTSSVVREAVRRRRGLDLLPSAALTELEVTSPSAHATVAGQSTIRIVSPKPGDVPPGDFDVVVETTNSALSEGLFGKPGMVGTLSPV